MAVAYYMVRIMISGLAVLAIIDWANLAVGLASAQEQIHSPEWVARGMVAALTNSNDAVVSAALRFPIAPDIFQQIPEQDRDRVVEFLITSLGKDKEELARRSAAQALGVLAKYKSNAAIDALIICLGDSNADVRSAAVDALGALVKVHKDKSSDVLDALIKRLDDGHRDARSAVEEALRVWLKDNREKQNAAIDALIVTSQRQRTGCAQRNREGALRAAKG